MEALDLSVRPPRSPYDKVGGLFLLGRTIDKLRTELPGGKPGEYHISGLSERMLSELGIDHDALLAVVAQAPSEEDVVAWVHAQSKGQDYEALNEQLQTRVLDDTNRERLAKKYPVILKHPEVARLFDVILLDDSEMFAHKDTR